MDDTEKIIHVGDTPYTFTYVEPTIDDLLELDRFEGMRFHTIRKRFEISLRVNGEKKDQDFWGKIGEITAERIQSFLNERMQAIRNEVPLD